MWVDGLTPADSERIKADSLKVLMDGSTAEGNGQNGIEGMRCFMQTKSVWLATNPGPNDPLDA